ncbi:Chitin synthase, class 7 [Lobulomyces angularis]|nr:Chitin synthase, class 7 [Lobulomyces angularis]
MTLFILHYIITGAMILIYIISQIVLVLTTRDDCWPLGDVFFGVTFLVAGKLFQLLFSTQICLLSKHYIDGLFFETVFNLLTVMMVYKYWDSITREDLEYSVNYKSNPWEVKNINLNEKNIV